MLCSHKKSWLFWGALTFSSSCGSAPFPRQPGTAAVNHPEAKSTLLPPTPVPNSSSPPPTNDLVIGFSLKQWQRGLCAFSWGLIIHRSAPGSVRGEGGILVPGAWLGVDGGLCLPVSWERQPLPWTGILGTGSCYCGEEKQGSYSVPRRLRTMCGLPFWDAIFSSVKWE